MVYGTAAPNDAWCFIFNPLQYSKGIMTTSLRTNITGVADFYRDAEANKLPAVSFVRPMSRIPDIRQTPAVSAYEYFLLSIAKAVIKNVKLFGI